MKRIIIALGIIATMHAGAQAQNCNCKCKKVVKHTVHQQKPKAVAPAAAQPAEGQQVAAQNCRVVPYQVCSINPDRRSVSCYKTIDPNDQQPFTDDVTLYGATGDVPNQPQKQAVETIVLNAPAPASYCKRNKEDNATICYSPGGILRDENGFYHYK